MTCENNLKNKERQSAVLSAVFPVNADAFRTLLKSNLVKNVFIFIGVVEQIVKKINVQNAQAVMLNASRHFAKILKYIRKQYPNE